MFTTLSRLCSSRLDTNFGQHEIFGLQNKGSYVPEGLSKEAYAKFQKEEEAAKVARAKKFVIGKQTESLTEWMLKEEKKGNVGKGLLLKGHRMVKAKYDEFYTDESPV